MPDLESQIARWRSEMMAGGIKAPALLDELENHLRDDTDAQVAAGMGEQDAFATSAARIGQAAALKKEFDKVGGVTGHRIRMAWLVLAGIPSSHHASPMNAMNSSSNLEPRWVTYTKAAVFSSPALFLWTISALFLMPKLQMICREAGVALPRVYEVTDLLSHNVVLASAAILLALALLEWRWNRWSQFRRVSLGGVVFVLNATVLTLLTLMVVFALVAAPNLVSHAR
jgi:hypothetical protein